MSVLHLAAKFGQLKVIDMLWGKTPIEQVSVKVRIRDESICKRLLFTEVVLKSNYIVSMEHVRKRFFSLFLKNCFFIRKFYNRVCSKNWRGFSALSLITYDSEITVVPISKTKAVLAETCSNLLIKAHFLRKMLCWVNTKYIVACVQTSALPQEEGRLYTG